MTNPDLYPSHLTFILPVVLVEMQSSLGLYVVWRCHYLAVFTSSLGIGERKVTLAHLFSLGFKLAVP